MILIVVLVVAVLAGACVALLILTYIFGTRKVVVERQNAFRAMLDVPK